MRTARYTHLSPWSTELDDRQHNSNHHVTGELTPGELLIQRSLASVQKRIDDLTEATLRHMQLSSIASGNGLTFYSPSGLPPPPRSLLPPDGAITTRQQPAASGNHLPSQRVQDVSSHSRYLIDMRYPAYPVQHKHELNNSSTSTNSRNKTTVYTSTVGLGVTDDQSEQRTLEHVTSSVRHEEHYMRLLNDILSQAVPIDYCIPSPTKLLDFLYIGGYKDAEDVNKLRRLGITHVFNCASLRNGSSHGTGQSPYPSTCGILAYDQVDAADDESYNMLQHFDRASQFIDRAKFGEGRCLVHCAMGINRSGAICAAYIIADQRMKLLDAVRLMKQRRGTVLCNRGFQRLLIRFARQRGLL